MAQQAGRDGRGQPLLAVALGALIGLLLIISLAFMVINSGVMGWYLSAFATGNLPLMVPCLAVGSVGLLMATRRPGNAIGWLYVAGGLWLSFAVALGGYAAWATVVRPGAFGGTAAEWVVNWVWAPFLSVMLTFPFLLFPDGRLVSRRWQPVAWGSGVFAVAWTVVVWFSNANYQDTYGRPKRNPLTPEGSIGVIEIVEPLVQLGVLMAISLSVLSLVVRFRRGSVRERAQIKWLGLSGFVAGVFLAQGLATVWTTSDTFLIAVAISLIPLSVGVAILRYHLYDIDRIVSRTVSYGVVTVVVLATYALVVTSVSRLLPASNTLAVAGATLAAAAVALPALRWVRERVDRRFDRAGFDAQQQVEAFAGRMAASVDADDVAADLQAVVQRTLAPSSAGVWVVRSGT
jgi:hypothetical protein